jgi:hypothetical protein
MPVWTQLQEDDEVGVGLYFCREKLSDADGEIIRYRFVTTRFRDVPAHLCPVDATDEAAWSAAFREVVAWAKGQSGQALTGGRGAER